MRAVDGIDLQVAPGEIYGFLGPNGAGKSTTLLILTTLLPPTAGTARVAGLDVVSHGAEVRRAIGASLQESALDPFLTGREHMRLQSALHGLAKAERAARGQELLDRVGLSDAADRKVGGYSGGMKRRWTSPSRSCTIRGCSSWTSPPPAWTRRAAPRCGMRCGGLGKRWRHGLSDYAVPRRRQTYWPIVWGSSTAARSWLRVHRAN